MVVITNHVGLNVNYDNIQLVEIISKDNNYCLENVDEEFFEETILEDTKEAKYIHILQNAFNEIVLRKSLSTNNISVTLPPSFFKIFEIPVDKNLTKSDLNEYIKWELSKLYPIKGSDYFTFQKIVLNPLHFESFKRVLVFTISTSLLKRIHKFCARNNLILKRIDNAHISASSYIQNNTAETIQLSIFIENNDLSAILFSKKNIVFQTSKKISLFSEISVTIQDIIEEINNGKLNSGKLEDLYLFGYNITSELISNIEDSIKLNIKLINPFSDITITEEFSDNKYVNDNSLRFSPASAIALRI